jgi:biopolymer transport protein ExbB
MRRRYGGCWSAALVFSGWLICCSLGITAVAVLGAAPAAAQEKTDNSAETGDSTEGAAPKVEEESFLMWLHHSLTWRYDIAFLIVSFTGVAFVVMNAMCCRRQFFITDSLIPGFEQQLNEKHYQEAYELAKNDGSMLGQILAAGMAKLSNGYDAALQAMQEVGVEENLNLDQKVSYLSLVAQIGPLFGLLGTVDGMVQAFAVIAHSNITPKPSELAQGIGTALVTTVVGLCIAIPAIAIHHFIRNRYTKMVTQVGILSENLMQRFAGVGPTKKA